MKLLLLLLAGGVDCNFNGFFTLDGYECFAILFATAFCTDHVVACIEALDGKRSAVGIVCQVAVDIDLALARDSCNLDAALRDCCAEVEVVALVATRPNVYALVDKFIALVNDNESLAAGLHTAVGDWALAEVFTTEEHLASWRIGSNVNYCRLTTRWWFFSECEQSHAQNEQCRKGKTFTHKSVDS